MGSSTKIENKKGETHASTNDSETDPIIATTSAKNNNQEAPKKKKKKPMQHLVAGGTAGLVESSVCHPLDTIKTRMQLRRQNTMRKRALSSLRDVSGKRGEDGAGEGRRALRRTAGGGDGGGSATKGSSGGTAGGSETTTTTTKTATTARTTSASVTRSDANAPRGEPETAKGRSNATTNTAPTQRNAPHDVGWKQRLPPGPSSSAAAEAASQMASSSTSSSSAAKNAATSAAKSTATPPPSATGTTVVAPLGPFGTARRIVEREGPTALYKGLTAVYTGIIPKMAIRFVSFEHYRDVLGGWHDRYYHGNNTQLSSSRSSSPPPSVTFAAGLLCGLTEAVAIVTPAEVCKIRMQSQYHSLMDPTRTQHAKYKNVVQTAILVAREEGAGALYKGVVPTMLRQGCNQAVNFTAYNWSKRRILAWKRERREEETGVVGGGEGEETLDHWQSLLLGGLSGGMGPLVNNPLDVVKTRMQKQVIHPGKEPKYKSLLQSCIVIGKEEGTPALWKGITPRLMRIMPGQAITFMTYEAVSARMEKYGWFD